MRRLTLVDTFHKYIKSVFIEHSSNDFTEHSYYTNILPLQTFFFCRSRRKSEITESGYLPKCEERNSVRL